MLKYQHNSNTCKTEYKQIRHHIYYIYIVHYSTVFVRNVPQRGNLGKLKNASSQVINFQLLKTKKDT